MIAPIVAALAPILGTVAKSMFPDPEQQAKAEREMTNAILSHHQALESAAASVIKAEAKAGGLASQWRPILMLVFTGIIANNYILAPYVAMFGGVNVILEIPLEMWDLLKIGVGGYIMGRSGEKIASNYIEKRNG